MSECVHGVSLVVTVLICAWRFLGTYASHPFSYVCMYVAIFTYSCTSPGHLDVKVVTHGPTTFRQLCSCHHQWLIQISPAFLYEPLIMTAVEKFGNCISSLILDREVSLLPSDILTTSTNSYNIQCMLYGTYETENH